MAMEEQADESGRQLPATIQLSDLSAWKTALHSGRPVLVHLNADTTWLVQLPYPKHAAPADRSHLKILIDPWLQGPQSDVASWFSTQWHVVAPTVQTIQELNTLLEQVEERPEGSSAIDVVAISHEFTDHCHQETLLELRETTPIFATDKAADLIRSWSYFQTVVTMPGFPGPEESLHDTLGNDLLPPWIGIGRVVTEGNALYFHSAVVIAFTLKDERLDEITMAEAIIYSPHGIKSSDLRCIKAAGIQALALLHGMHDVRIWMTKQLNLGALNGIEATRVIGARYWVATHDEAKRGSGLISWLLQRTAYTMRDAVQAEEAKLARQIPAEEYSELSSPGYAFVELGSGEGLVLE